MNNSLLIIISSWELKKYSNYDLLNKNVISSVDLYFFLIEVFQMHICLHTHIQTHKNIRLFLHQNDTCVTISEYILKYRILRTLCYKAFHM